MLTTTIIFLVWGFTLNMWYINWVVYPVGGILCGIVGTILKKIICNRNNRISTKYFDIKNK